MTDFDRWLDETFRRQGSELLVGPVSEPRALVQEDVEALITHLHDIAIRLPLPEQRWLGFTTCKECDGRGVFLDDKGFADIECRVCYGSGLAERQEGEI